MAEMRMERAPRDGEMVFWRSPHVLIVNGTAIAMGLGLPVLLAGVCPRLRSPQLGAQSWLPIVALYAFALSVTGLCMWMALVYPLGVRISGQGIVLAMFARRVRLPWAALRVAVVTCVRKPGPPEMPRCHIRLRFQSREVALLDAAFHSRVPSRSLVSTIEAACEDQGVPIVRTSSSGVPWRGAGVLGRVLRWIGLGEIAFALLHWHQQNATRAMGDAACGAALLGVGVLLSYAERRALVKSQKEDGVNTTEDEPR